MKMSPQTRRAGGRAKGSCRGFLKWMRTFTYDGDDDYDLSSLTMMMMPIQVVKKRTRGMAMLSSFCITGKAEAKG